jgi:hypothetical protein
MSLIKNGMKKIYSEVITTDKSRLKEISPFEKNVPMENVQVINNILSNKYSGNRK